MKSLIRFGEFKAILAVILITALIGACNGSNQASIEATRDNKQGSELVETQVISMAEGEKIQVVVTTNILGDIVSQIGGDQIKMTVLMGIGEDPHSYVPTPADFAAIHDAHVIFAVGAGLEVALDKMFINAGGEAEKVEVSDGVDLRINDHDDHQGDSETDPHVWFSIPNVIIWVHNIQTALMKLDVQNSEYFEGNAVAYIQELEALDLWIFEQVAQV
ncbi:MAG: metal ABC transporter substrate-binding protein, partial [Anaerolineaceae bacterium]|nr:metal ABC transporter substrate-binding protein [Anaerolineaceae bacterium]